jgi:hypothetical protein
LSSDFPHIANTGVIFCMDDRPALDAAYRHLVDSCEHGHAFSLRFGGAALRIAHADTREFVLKDMRLMEKLNVTTVILANHLSCAACADDLEKSGLSEIKFHLQLLTEAARSVEKLGFEVVCKIFNVDGSEVRLPQHRWWWGQSDVASCYHPSKHP